MAGERTLGVATTKAQIELGTIDGATIGATTPSSGAFTTLAASGNVTLGDATTDTIGLYGVTPITQRASSLQATSLVSATSASFAAAYKDALLEIMNALQAVGIWKGAA
jgi:hypothetical protein